MTILRFQAWEGNEARSIEGEDFVRFLDGCFARSTAIALTKDCVRTSWYQKTGSLERALRPWLSRKFLAKRWFGYAPARAIHCPPFEIEVQLYPASDEVKRAILACYQDLFLSYPLREGDGGAEGKYCYALGDLSFFRGDRMFLGTVSHESICMVRPIDSDLRGFLHAFGAWVPETDEDVDFICLSDRE